jgi:RNA polymerase sigma-70 factor (ECF subfamily)
MGLNDQQLLLLDGLQKDRHMYYRLAYSLMGNEADALDAISQMTLLVVEKIGTLRSAEAFSPWSKKILVNVCRDMWRRSPKSLPLDDNGLAVRDPEREPDEDMTIRQFIRELPEKQREVILLRYYMDFEYQDIAHYLAIPEGTVKSRLNRATDTLRDRMKGAYHG